MALTPEFFATEFLSEKEGTDFVRDGRVEQIAAALREVGVTALHGILGAGDFGMAASLDTHRVVKLTTDETEVRAAAVLTGQTLPNVAAVYGAWFVRGVEVEQYHLARRVRAGIVVLQRLQPVCSSRRDCPLRHLSELVGWVKVHTNADPLTVDELAPAEARARLNAASLVLQDKLRELAAHPEYADFSSFEQQVAVEIARGLQALRERGVYTVDAHAGNIGYDKVDHTHKLFDVGSSSAPAHPTAPVVPARSFVQHGVVSEDVQVAEAGPDRGQAAHEATRRLARKSCAWIQDFLFDYLDTKMEEYDPYDFQVYLDEWIEHSGLGLDADLSVADLTDAQRETFRKWLLWNNKHNQYLHDDPTGAPAYLTLHAKEKMSVGSWFVHFSHSYFTGRFDRGTTIDGLALSTWKKQKDRADCSLGFEDQATGEVVFGFAFEVGATRRVHADARRLVEYGVSRYGRNIVIFQCDCAITAYHDGDGETQAIFPVCSEYNVIHVAGDEGDLTVTLNDGTEKTFETLEAITEYVDTRRPKRQQIAAKESSASELTEATRTRTNLATRFFHGSWSDLPVGTILHGAPGSERLPVEQAFEHMRPSSAVSRIGAVFMVSEPTRTNLDAAGGGGPGGFVYEVEPIGAVSGPYDGGWHAEIVKLYLDKYQDRRQALTKNMPAAFVRMADAYWRGAPCRGDLCAGTWEWVTPEARIVRRLQAPSGSAQEARRDKVPEELRAALPDLVRVAQQQYDAWQQDPEGFDEEVGGGGICHLIADKMIDVLSKQGLVCTTVSSNFEVHVNVVVQLDSGVWEVDIRPYVYERGGGYTWTKIPNVTFEPSDISIARLSPDPEDFKEYAGDE